MSKPETTPCPGRHEAIAALVDGGLTPTEREILEEHLADCDLCLELLAETTALVHAAQPGEDDDLTAMDVDGDEPETADLLPFASPKSSPGRRRISLPKPWIAAAATGLVAAALWPLLGTAVTDADLVASLGASPALATFVDTPLVDTTRDRSAGWQPGRAAAVELGALRVRLQWALTHEHLGTSLTVAGDLLDAARSLVPADGDGAPGPHAAADGLYLALEDAASTTEAPVQKALRHLDASLAELSSPQRDDVNLGRWIESGRLAAAAASTEALTSQARRRVWKDLEPFLAGEAAPFELAEARDLEDRPIDESALARLSELYERALVHYLVGPSSPSSAP